MAPTGALGSAPACFLDRPGFFGYGELRHSANPHCRIDRHTLGLILDTVKLRLEELKSVHVGTRRYAYVCIGA